MDLPDRITRRDLLQAAGEVGPLDPARKRNPDLPIMLLHARRYDPRAVLARAGRDIGEAEGIGIPMDDDTLAAFFAERAVPCIPSSKIDAAVRDLKTLASNLLEREAIREIVDARDEVIGRYRPLFTGEAVKNLSEADIGGFLAFNNNRHWSGLTRQRRALTGDMDALHRALAILVDESRPIDERLNEIRPLKGEPMVKRIGPAVITAILHVSDPEQYSVWNTSSESGWVTAGLWPAYRENIPFGSYYLAVNEIQRALAREAGVDLWTLDALLWCRTASKKTGTGRSGATAPETVWADVRNRLACSFDCDRIPFEDLIFTEDEEQRLNTEILGALRSGKHIILTGPPGTGKSKVAQAICTAIAGPGNYHACTASPDWSTAETIGGYRPNPDGTLRFRPGPVLQSFQDDGRPANRWLIVDEINRAGIDRAFGPLFSALTGDDVILPFEAGDEPVRLIGRPEERTPLTPGTFIVHPDWRIVATMNTYDRSSLNGMSYAFMRRFAFIMVDTPETVDALLVGRFARAWGFKQSELRCRQVAALWNLVNRHRKIGPALFRDIYQYIDNAPGAEMESAIAMYLFPQLDGLSGEKQQAFVNDLLRLPFIVKPERLKRKAAAFFHTETRGCP